MSGHRKMLLVGKGLKRASKEKLFAVGQLQDTIKEPGAEHV